MKAAIIVVIIVLLFAAFYFFGGGDLLSPQDEKTYQAVFLSNGQVYFGKLTSVHGWLVLRDVYYLETTKPLQSEAEAGDTLQPLSSPKIKLVKLGAELHGPDGEMFIDRDQILFWENMKSDSKVLAAIREYQSVTP